ncbi:MAG: hypothetical protein A2042_10105 [Candidatus Schekmanbacteria bacterium GWA2_38_11]|uniref:M23ase beta-sheet core domain-containing protein n=1 Tax=Candidatus Schekmanbacteria bacterium GWA2_38_11 TaxID=1817876 RepID=A0A1F7R9W2_9BACT|nr:MAG: hypothetical protein A2042_10105 [Candidatus Schekmanbacteria bacterium GWA2_38_11]
MNFKLRMSKIPFSPSLEKSTPTKNCRGGLCPCLPIWYYFSEGTRRINPRRGFPQLWESLFRLDMRPLPAYRQAGRKIFFYVFQQPVKLRLCIFPATIYLILVVFFSSLFLIGVKESLSSEPAENIEKKISESQKKLKDYDGKITQEKKKLEKLKKDKKNVSEEIKKLDDLIAFKNRELETYRNEYEKNLLLLNELQQRIDQQTYKFSAIKKRLSKRLRNMYKQGNFYKMEIIYNSKDFFELSQKVKLLEIVARNDGKLIGEFKSELTQLDGMRKNLEASKNSSYGILEKIKTAEKDILFRKSEKERFLAEISSNEKKHTASIKKAERDSEKLQDLIKGLLKEKVTAEKDMKGRNGSRRFKVTKGNLPWPVEGEVVKTFGKQIDKEFNTYLYNKGITIKVNGENKFCSIFPGTVLYADNFSMYGKLMIVDHGEGFYSVYGYASELYAKAGEKVTQGKILGRVDTKESDGRSELYFEVRYKGVPQDPLIWLKKK